MNKDVKISFQDLNRALLIAMASQWTSQEEARVYQTYSNIIISLQECLENDLNYGKV